jgi:hypothetical protein
VLFVGDDWAEAHHDIEIENEEGRVLARRRLPEGLAGITMLHELIAEHLDPTAEPAALAGFGADLAGREAVAVLAAAPTPDQGRRLSQARIEALLRKSGRQRNVTATAAKIRASLASKQLTARPGVVPAYAASASALIVVLSAMAEQTEVLARQVEQGFGQHPDAEIYLSQPGLGVILGARVLAEFGDDPDRYADAKSRKNYSGMSPITKASGTKRVVLARYARNRPARRRLVPPGLLRPQSLTGRPRPATTDSASAEPPTTKLCVPSPTGSSA